MITTSTRGGVARDRRWRAVPASVVRESSCARKQRHSTAAAATARLRERTPYRCASYPLNVYGCPFCGGWHYGRVPPVAERYRVYWRPAAGPTDDWRPWKVTDRAAGLRLFIRALLGAGVEPADVWVAAVAPPEPVRRR